MQIGFTKSYRSKWENPTFRNLLEVGIWSWICDTAVWQETRIRFNGELITLQRGQLITSIRFIAKGFCISEQAARTFLDHINTDGMINTQATHRGTIITICNYDKYQSNENTDNTPLTQHQHTTNTNKKEDKKERKKDNNIELLSKEILPDFVPQAEWDSFLEMRKKMKKPPTEKAKMLLIQILEKLKNLGHDPKLVLEQSIMNNYQGLFELKSEGVKSYGKQITETKSDRAKQAVMRAAIAGGFAD